MSTRTLREWAAERAEELPGAGAEQPFGPDHTVYKVRGKMFLLFSNAPGGPYVTLKARPADANTLREAFDDVSPGYHMNKRHWISLTTGGTLEEALVRDLVTESYLLVVETLPRAQRPVDPSTFGQPAS
ncbi:MmcQ/YjbR family DNA-binding protein [Leucobacter komagatae]|uniref:Cytoplasmic protein n=1 Tax=Leucobacter komagatae TaxID=55969 RepID=A0A0D0I0U5_9MICO|nr:MmcQ/YjbR family DNA-binding protein [Leucobacter komagatae]KIP53391.1 cytoplasmic protein [Leucobacter komagatae]